MTTTRRTLPMMRNISMIRRNSIRYKSTLSNNTTDIAVNEVLLSPLSTSYNTNHTPSSSYNTNHTPSS